MKMKSFGDLSADKIVSVHPLPGKILAVDVQYNGSTGHIGGALFERWSDEKFTEWANRRNGVADYKSGSFYERELPCLVTLVEMVLKSQLLSTIIVDGYVDLGLGIPGLGRHLFNALNQKIHVVGVAKTPLKHTPSVEILRGTSKKPLYITSTGDAAADAVLVKSMAGPDRIPHMLRHADRIARKEAEFWRIR